MTPDPHTEHGGTYVVPDHSNVEENKRVALQDRMFTAAMGGVMPEEQDPARFRRVLDVGCGAGAWLIEMASTYPAIPLLVGVDINSELLGFARAQAEAQQLSDDRVQFRVMNALQMLEFPTDFFTLVNQRLGQSWLRTWEWPKLLQEYLRVTRSGGVIRITESGVTETSPALTRFSELVLAAMFQSGHYFTHDWSAVIDQLPALLRQYGLHEVQTRAHTLVYRAGTPLGQIYAEDVVKAMNTLRPFVKKWAHAPEDYDALCEQVSGELQQPDFVATLHLTTAWGRAPEKPRRKAPTPEP